MLKELTIDGDASMEVLVTYKGEFRITIETVATFNLGARFKPYAVNLVLAVVLKELSGTLLLKIKRPPTNRLWFGFTAMPHLVLDLEPVVSTRQIKWALVLKPIESRIREVVSTMAKIIITSCLAHHTSKLDFLTFDLCNLGHGVDCLPESR
jgi:hypothetical protein